ncbi:MAG: FliM/FliN family flagellar motor switch protein [Sulfitobacter sp.]|nr:FliM/FliN family flagellar motor switch protein [Sulfitobacter sp.]
MSAEQAISLVQRKARTGREAQAARAMSLGRALRLTAAKQADQMLGLALGMLGVTRKPTGIEDVAASFDATTLFLLMDGPGSQVAAAVLDAPLVAGLIQQQTMGRVTPVPQEGPARQHTATDAALCAPFVEALLGRAALLPEEQADRELLQVYRFGVWAADPRVALLALEAPAFEVIEMTLDLAAGARVGKLTLVIPVPVRVAAQEERAQTDSYGPPHSKSLADNVLGLHAELTIALTRLRLPLQQITALKPGDLLDINLSSMAQALVLDKSGRAISRGTLGQIDGIRAVQVEQQKSRQQSEPRRRAADRAELDLPDVTQPFAAQPDRRERTAAPTPDIPRLSDVDVFGDIYALPELPDMEGAAQAADARYAALEGEAKEDVQKQAGW